MDSSPGQRGLNPPLTLFPELSAMHGWPDRNQNQMEEADDSNTIVSIRHPAERAPWRQPSVSRLFLTRSSERLVSAAVERVGSHRASPFNDSGPRPIVGHQRAAGMRDLPSRPGSP